MAKLKATATQTRKRKIVCYDGIGSHVSGIHTRKNFLRRMLRNTRGERRSCSKSGMRNQYPALCNHPSAGNIKGWIKWSGALLESKESCSKMIEAGKRANEERARLAKIPGTKEHQVVLDNIAIYKKTFPGKPLPNSWREHLTNAEQAKLKFTA